MLCARQWAVGNKLIKVSNGYKVSPLPLLTNGYKSWHHLKELLILWDSSGLAFMHRLEGNTTTGINLRSVAKMGSVAGTSFARHG